MSDDEFRPTRAKAGKMRRRPEWAREIRLRRERLVWSQNRLAKELELAADPEVRATLPSRSSIIREIRFHESGQHRPGPVYGELYRRVWEKYGVGVLDQELGLGCDLLVLAWTVGRLAQRVDRRTLLQLAAVASSGVALDPAERLMRALRGGDRPDEVTVTHLEARTRGLHRLEEHYPARLLYPALITHLNEVSALLEAGPPELVRRRLAVSAGESAILGAWFAWELGDAARATAISQVAGFVARHATDPAVGACMDGYRTYMTGGDTARSVRLAASALSHLGEADAATRAWLLARHAEESAVLGDRKTALESIQQATEVYAFADINARPWTCFLDSGRFASMRLSVYSRIQYENEAVEAIDDIVAHVGQDTEVKKLCVVKADLALARFRLGDVAEAVTHARSALAATAEMAFPLGWDRLDQVVSEFRPAKAQAAREFRSEYAAMRPAAAPPSLA
ncbi:XRE family transcriptional regulator [Actinomadura craniellae]|uniref:XRE family transcriptional regulator n=1 Tax=Actinomadura craniellae TaxID=2231787 RepID=A0A365HBB6_9ACTN|nr:XRE family transcriptional regulator [Actinomadura craniellae]RAY16216.1 XRE family transcriptional regulator [Actinomadura craniellae]